MTNLPLSLYTAAQVRELDATAIEKFSVRGYTLMQRAGQGAFEILRARWPSVESLLVVLGTGNNGGDGYVIARMAFEVGLETSVVQLGDPETIAGDALEALKDYVYLGGQVEIYEGGPLPAADVVVDAIFGTGLRREVTDDWAAAIRAMNEHQGKVLAVDIPSGLHSDTGQALGIAVKADCTVTFVGLKQGLFTGLARDYCGDIEFDNLQLPFDVYADQTPSAYRIDLSQFDGALRARPRSSHKGKFGHVLVVGGDIGMPGAARMAAEAAARVGAGLVSVATRHEHAAHISGACPVLMVNGVESAEALEPLLDKATLVAIGPGLGKSNWSAKMFNAVVDAELPLIVDADALNLLAAHPRTRDNWVLTPHPGEAARLRSKGGNEIEFDRFGAARELQQEYGGVCVLKGAGSLICSNARTAVCTDGNPGMATGGMGDVLTGIIAGLAAQQMPLEAAAELGVCVHAAAADLAAVSGERGLLATDLFEHLRKLANPGGVD